LKASALKHEEKVKIFENNFSLAKYELGAIRINYHYPNTSDDFSLSVIFTVIHILTFWTFIHVRKTNNALSEQSFV
jgi:hypothetical protein